MGEAAGATAHSPGPGGLLDRFGAAPAAASFGVVGGVFALYLASAVVFGGVAEIRDPAGFFGMQPVVYINAVLCAVLVHSWWALLREPGRLRSEAVEIGAVLDGGDELVARLGAARISWRGIAAGAGVGLALPLLGMYLNPEYLPPFHLAWNLIFQVALFGTMGQLSANTQGTMGELSQLARMHARVDLLDPSRLQVFARQGLRYAFYWFLGSSIALLLVLQSRVPWLPVPVILITVALGVWAMMSATRGVQARVAEVKRRELVRVRAEIARSREALGREDGNGAELPALLAWEARVVSVPEWPFDTSTLLRFGLLILVPVGSWLGGALVERLLNAALD